MQFYYPSINTKVSSRSSEKHRHLNVSLPLNGASVQLVCYSHRARPLRCSRIDLQYPHWSARGVVSPTTTRPLIGTSCNNRSYGGKNTLAA